MPFVDRSATNSNGTQLVNPSNWRLVRHAPQANAFGTKNLAQVSKPEAGQE
jgi:hypothetical protein